MSTFYIIVTIDDIRKVVAASNGVPREFPKQKKARNFINGRPYLEAKNPQIVIDIDDIKHHFKVDL